MKKKDKSFADHFDTKQGNIFSVEKIREHFGISAIKTALREFYIYASNEQKDLKDEWS